MAPHKGVCEVCGDPPTNDNPLQSAHKVPYMRGVIFWKLTPEWLDNPSNLVWAHRRLCNQHVELSDDEVRELLDRLEQ